MTSETIDCAVIRDPERGGVAFLVEDPSRFVSVLVEGGDVHLVREDGERMLVEDHGHLAREIVDGTYDVAVVRHTVGDPIDDILRIDFGDISEPGAPTP